MTQNTVPFPTVRYIKLLLFTLLVTAVILSFSLYRLFFAAESDRTMLTDADSSAFPHVHFVLDAGHGGEDGGASANGVLEKDLNFAITTMLSDYFALTPFDVSLTRTDDHLLYRPGEENRKKYYDLVNRVEFAENIENAVFISIHQNKFEIPKYKGLQVYYSPNDARSSALAERIQSAASAYLDPTNKRQIKQADRKIRVLNSLKMPAVLVECGFLSNPEEAQLLASPEYQRKVAFVIFLSSLQFLEESGDAVT